MRPIIKQISIIAFLFIFLFSVQGIVAQITKEQAKKIKVKSDGEEYEIGAISSDVWVLSNGKDIVYAGRDGAGGFENEGQSLWIYNLQNKHHQKILSQYFIVDDVIEKKLTNGKTLLLVKFSDGALGANYFSVVDPDRGEIFFKNAAKIVQIKGDQVKLIYYKNGDAMVDDGMSPQEIAEYRKKYPPKYQNIDLKDLLNNDVIFNENSWSRYEEENENLKRVKVFFWRFNDIKENSSFVIAPVYRYVNPKAPLRPTLEALFGEAKKDEADYGFGNPTFGMKFEGVSIKNGTAIIRFSQPKNQTNYGSLGPMIFEEALIKTAMQFPTVKKVKVCAVGETLIDSQLTEQFPKC